MKYLDGVNGNYMTDIKAGLHYQSFCDHSRNFGKVNSKFWKICKKSLMQLSQYLTLSHFPQTFDWLQYILYWHVTVDIAF